MIDERVIIGAQIDALRQELGQADRVFAEARIAPALRLRVSDQFQKLFGLQRGKLDSVRERFDAGEPVADSWKALRELREDCTPLLNECLALLQGALGRAQALDNGLCAIADVLLDDLSRRTAVPWDRFTILGEAESFHDLAGVVRLRFPGLSVWHLPLLGHEFGHFVADELKTRRRDRTYRYLFQELLKTESRNQPQEGRYLHERFADVFAVYVLGPAPVYASLLLHFDPASEDGEYHPCDAERVYLMLETLAILDKDTGAPPIYTPTIATLRDAWHRSCTAASVPTEITAERLKELTRLFTAMSSLLTTELGNARYDGWGRASSLVKEIEPSQPKAPKLRPEVMIADVLNAAWLCRTKAQADIERVTGIGERAVKAAREIVRRQKR